MQSLLLQQSCNKYQLFSFNAWSPCQKSHFSCFIVSSNVCIKIPKKDCTVDLTLCRASLTSFAKTWWLLTAFGYTPAIGVLSDPLLKASTYMPVLSKESNRTHSLTTESLWEFPHPLEQTYLDQHLNRKASTAIQIYNSRAMSLGKRNFNNIKMIFFCLFFQSLSFFLWEWEPSSCQASICDGFFKSEQHNRV